MFKEITKDEILQGLIHVLGSPQDGGKLEAIVIRPDVDQRELRSAVKISPEGGLEGDRWERSCWLRLPDGRPDPSVQISLMNSRILNLISRETNRISLAGDNLVVDFDLSAANLPPGQQLRIGEAIVEVSGEAHNGCKKFMSRYGKEAVKFVNSPEGKKLHLRGLYAKVILAGVIRVGDRVEKVQI